MQKRALSQRRGFVVLFGFGTGGLRRPAKLLSPCRGLKIFSDVFEGGLGVLGVGGFEDAEVAVCFEDDGGDLVHGGDAGAADGLEDLVADDPLVVHGLLVVGAFEVEQARLGLDEPAEKPPLLRGAGDDPLHRDQQAQGGQAVEDGDAAAEDRGGHCGPEGDGDHEVEDVELGERPLAGDTQGQDQEYVRSQAGDKHFAQRAEIVKPEHANLLRFAGG